MNLQLASSFLYQPTKAFQQLKNLKAVYSATLILIFAKLALLLQDFPLDTSLILAIGRAAIIGVLVLILVSFYVYGTARLFDGKASYFQTYQAMALAYLPMVLFGPFGLLQTLWPHSKVLGELGYLINLLLSFWVIYLQVLAIRETHQVSMGGAIISLIAVPILIMIALPLLLVFLGFSIFTLL